LALGQVPFIRYDRLARTSTTPENILLPPIPQQLSTMDDAIIRAQHFFLEPTDTCFYIWGYARGPGCRAAPNNSLILNLKKKPSDVACNPLERAHKLRAILHCAVALRTLVPRCWLESRTTLVPIPPSKAAGHPDYDDRLQQILQLAFGNTIASTMPLLQQTRSTPADHQCPDRQRFDELLKITRLNEAAAKAAKPNLVIIDDVLNTGKHFKVAQALLMRRFPNATIRGLFLARCEAGRNIAT
jgi:hypothetical protein